MSAPVDSAGVVGLCERVQRGDFLGREEVVEVDEGERHLMERE